METDKEKNGLNITREERINEGSGHFDSEKDPSGTDPNRYENISSEKNKDNADKKKDK
ncbi:hypothetical protein GCM10007424_00040 [Flavobacterium suaedae]|uniref:Uncharacterized protein n=1 Tax=Flavobacterium suaedae TaxID=1767027 RepID=A0ABQ1JAZ8_9FLAO|nr:hypothetical protein [Flavobacterium suaedae]GGB64191.1 hypothetical protein GCM10007424_00040 [Flavobacterium suaedae]